MWFKAIVGARITCWLKDRTRSQQFSHDLMLVRPLNDCIERVAAVDLAELFPIVGLSLSANRKSGC